MTIHKYGIDMYNYYNFVNSMLLVATLLALVFSSSMSLISSLVCDLSSLKIILLKQENLFLFVRLLKTYFKTSEKKQLIYAAANSLVSF